MNSLSIEASGAEISAASRRNIFGPIYQIDGSTTRMQGGNGLGLAICNRLALLLGGDIRVSSSPEGSSFVVATPVELPAATRPAFPDSGNSAS